MKINETENFFCVDCERPTQQKYHYTNQVDNDLVYISTKCGCENSLPKEEDETETAQ